MNTEAKFPKGETVDVPAYFREHGNDTAADEWEQMNEEHKDKFKIESTTAHDRTADESLAIMEKFTLGEKWIPEDLEEGRCTPAPNPDCPVGSPQYNLAQTFKKHPEWGEKGGKRAEDTLEELTRLAGFQPGQMAEEGWDPGDILYETDEDEDDDSGGSMVPGLELNRGASDDPDLEDGDEKEGKFEKGKPADPTKNMSPEDKKKWLAEKERNKDKFTGKSAALLSCEYLERLVREAAGKEVWKGKMTRNNPTFGRKGDAVTAEKAGKFWTITNVNKSTKEKDEKGFNPVVKVHAGDFDPDDTYQYDLKKTAADDSLASPQHLASDDEDGDEKEGKFEKGKPADPTKNMTPEEAAKWKAENEKNRDKFKKKSLADESLALLQRLASTPVTRERLTQQKRATINDSDTLSQLVDMAMESAGASGEVGDREWSAVERAAQSWDSAVEKALLKWVKDPKNKAKFDMTARVLSRAKRDSDIVDVLMNLKGGAGYLYFMEMEGHGVGTWDGDWDILFIDHRSTIKELSNYIKRSLSSAYRNLSGAIEEAAFSADVEDEDEGHYASRTAARAPGGLYGFTKNIQADCERSARKISKAAVRLAKRAYTKDERVAPFLSLHGKRSKSLTARILTAAMKEVGPKVASDVRLEELRSNLGTSKEGAQHIPGLKVFQRQNPYYRALDMIQSNRGRTTVGKGHDQVTPLEAKQLIDARLISIAEGPFGKEVSMNSKGEKSYGESVEQFEKLGTSDKQATDKEARYGLYGYPAKTANLGIQTCAILREEAGRVAAGLHGRRSTSHSNIIGFLHAHGKQARCLFSKLLHRSYPEAGMKCASPIPKTVQDWLSWED